MKNCHHFWHSGSYIAIPFNQDSWPHQTFLWLLWFSTPTPYCSAWRNMVNCRQCSVSMAYVGTAARGTYRQNLVTFLQSLILGSWAIWSHGTHKDAWIVSDVAVVNPPSDVKAITYTYNKPKQSLRTVNHVMMQYFDASVAEAWVHKNGTANCSQQNVLQSTRLRHTIIPLLQDDCLNVLGIVSTVGHFARDHVSNTSRPRVKTLP